MPHILQSQRSHLYQEMHAATAQRDSYDPRREMAQILLLDKAIMHLEADLRWLDMTKMRLEDIKGQPLPEPEIRRRGRPRKGDDGSTYPPPERSVWINRLLIRGSAFPLAVTNAAQSKLIAKEIVMSTHSN